MRPLLRSARCASSWTSRSMTRLSMRSRTPAGGRIGRNSQPWRFIVIADQATLRAMADAGLPQTARSRRRRRRSPSPCRARRASGRRRRMTREERRSASWWRRRSSASAPGSRGCGRRSGQPMAELLGLPDDRYIRTIVAGHPTDAARRPKRRRGGTPSAQRTVFPRALAALSVPRGRESDPSLRSPRGASAHVSTTFTKRMFSSPVPRVVGAARARAGRIVVDDDRPPAPLPRPCPSVADRDPVTGDRQGLGRLAVRRRALVGAVRPVPTGPLGQLQALQRPAAPPTSATSAMAAAAARPASAAGRSPRRRRPSRGPGSCRRPSADPP